MIYFHNRDYFAIKILLAFCNVGDACYNLIGKNTTINISTKKKSLLRVHVVVKKLGSFTMELSSLQSLLNKFYMKRSLDI